MKLFTQLIFDLDQTNKTKEKIELLKNYFENEDENDKIWALYFLIGRVPKRFINSTKLKEWAQEEANLSAWIFEESYSIVGDLAETISLILPLTNNSTSKKLFEWIEYINELKNLDDKSKKDKIVSAWKSLDKYEIFVFNKLLLGGFRIGVAKNLVIKALSAYTNIDQTEIAHKITGNWDPSKIKFKNLITDIDKNFNFSKPYPFFLAHSIESKFFENENVSEWFAEWKWDGIRGQIIFRNNDIFVWSRGEELITENFPEFYSLKEFLDADIVIDGEILSYKENPLPFNILQSRIGRKKITTKVLQESPIIMICYDVLEYKNTDIRNLDFLRRRNILNNVLKNSSSKKYPIIISPQITFNSWEELRAIQSKARDYFAEGIMLKRKNSTYQVGRKKGDWWKWKLDPFVIDGVLIYAQRGHGRRANLYTDYTFAVWDQTKLVPFTKAYSGLSDDEIRQVNNFVIKNTKEKFGPVRSVKPELVFELAFEGIAESKRHKSGVALRFPRINRWRKDKKVEEADTLKTLKNFIN